MKTHRAFRTGLLGALVAAAITVTAAATNVPAAFAVGSGTVTGKVFNDKNVNGAISTTGNEGGVEGVTVKAYDSAGNLVGTATTGADGTYTLNVSGAATNDVRVEFSSTTNRFVGSVYGPDNGTDVQFVTLGSAAASKVNYGVQIPGEFCAANNVDPLLVVVRMSPNGYQQGLGNTGNCYNGSVMTFPWYGHSVPQEHPACDVSDPNHCDETKMLNILDTGATYGLAYDKVQSLMWTSAFVRRHAGLGPKGVGGLYVSKPRSIKYSEADMIIYNQQEKTAGPVASFDLTGAPWNLVLKDPSLDLSDAARGLDNSPNPDYANDAFRYSLDAQGFDAVGKQGIGDIAIDSGKGHLFLTNLYQKKIQRLAITGTATAPALGSSVDEWSMPSTCSDGTSQTRPFGLYFNEDNRNLWVGIVCTKEGTPVPTGKTKASQETGLVESASIWELNPVSGAWTKVTDINLKYPHRTEGCVSTVEFGPDGTPPDFRVIDADSTPADQIFNDNAFGCWNSSWHAWTGDWTSLEQRVENILASTLEDTPPVQIAYGQPMVSGISRLGDGSIVVGITDRLNFQTGYGNLKPNTVTTYTTALTELVAVSGDILLMCKTDSGYVQETGGGCTSTGPNGRTYSAANRPWANKNFAGENLEFFGDNLGDFSFSEEAHLELSNGSVVVWPPDGDVAKQQVAFTAMDPATATNTSGVRWSSATTGNAVGGESLRGSESGDGGFDKSANLGNLEIICDAAPIQIGNRVWQDLDGDGIQDPGEPALAGVTVHLYDAAGKLVGTAVTDSKGQYFFSSTLTEDPAGDGNNVGGGVVKGQDFTIKFDNPDDYKLDGPLYTFGPTHAGSSSDPTANIDSNVLNGQWPYIPVSVGGAGQIDQSFDAGFGPVESVGSRVWIDGDKDGIQDPNEPGFPNTKVELLNPDGSPALGSDGKPAVTYTDAQGNYVFMLPVPPPEGQQYKVKFTVPSGVDYTTQSAGGSTSANDSNPDPATGITPVFTLADHATGDTVDPTDPSYQLGKFGNPTIDAGVIVNPVAINGVVRFEKRSGGGVGDPNSQEGAFDPSLGYDPYYPPVSGVIVALYDENGNPAVDATGNPVPPTYTNGEGNYWFDNLLPGKYKIKFTSPDMSGTGSDPWSPQYATGNPAQDSNADPSTGWTDVFDVLPGPGTGTLPNAGDTRASTADDPVTAPYINDTIDALLYNPYRVRWVAMGSKVWYDDNKNGIQDPGEDPAEGVKVELLDPFGGPVYDFGNGNYYDIPNEIQPTYTDANGDYNFTYLVPGRYTVRFTAPNGSVWTQQYSNEPGANTKNDSNADPNTGLTPVFAIDYAVTGDTVDRFDPTHVAPEEYSENGGAWKNMYSNPTIDAGLVPALVGVGDYTWIDSNADGIQDPGEPVLPGVTVELYDADGNLVATTTTDENGYYFFDGLTVGDYAIHFTPPAGYASTSVYSGPNATDNNAYRNGWTDYFTLWSVPNSDGSLPDTDPLTEAIWADHTIDAGFVPIVAVGDYVWFDSDRDGVQDTKEKGIAGIWVFLKNPDGSDALDANGDPVGAVQTDDNGYYLFDNLVPGDYRVYFDVPGDYTISPQFSATGTDANDSNVNASGVWTNYTPVFTINPAATGNTVVDTDPDTAALFVDPTIDAGIYGPKVGFGNYVWIDANADGIQDGGELPLAGVKVELTDANGNPVYDYDGNLVVATFTDANGYYLFDNLVPGSYRVKFTAPDGYAFTTDFADTASNDSNADPYTGITPVFNLWPGAKNTYENSDPSINADFFNPTIDAGVVPRVAVGNYTWIDANRDGIQDPTEWPLQGVEVELTDPSGNPVYDADGNLVTSVFTDGNGHYLFDNLRPGSYAVHFIPPQGYVFTSLYSGTSGVDSNAYSNGWTDTFSVFGSTAGDTSADTDPNTVAQFVNPTIDAGFTPLVAIGDVVWYDTNKDGKQSVGEPPIAGVEVRLLDAFGDPARDANGNLVPAVFTDGYGKYLFDNLLPGSYSVQFIPPAGYTLTQQAVGVNPEVDSNASAAIGPDYGITPVFTVDGYNVGTTFPDTDPSTLAVFVNPTIDAGMYAVPVGVGNYVWIDADGDGIQDGGELPIAGVKVELLDANGNPVKDLSGKTVAPVFTDAAGHYFFDNLAPASYTMRFTPPAGYGLTTDFQGADTGLDSNPDPHSGLTPPFSIWPSATGNTTTDSDPATKAMFVNPTIDAGIVPLVAVGDFTWIDLDADGIQDVGEPVLAGVKVELLNPDGTVAKDADGNDVAAVYTDANGKYLFDNLLPGDYKIRFTPPTGYTGTDDFAGANTAVDSNPDPSTGVTPVFTVAPSVTGNTVADTNPSTVAQLVNPTIDAGFIPVLAVGNYVWFDRNGNGVQDASEFPVEGVKVELFNSDGTAVKDAAGNTVAAVYTDANGYYLFDNLVAGSYYVKFTAPDGYGFTTKNAGINAAVDSNAYASGVDLGKTPVFDLWPSASNVVADTDPATKAAYVNPTIDAGLVGPPLAVGNYVWIDTNGNGIQDAGEQPLDGVGVTLLNADGTPAVHVDGTPVGTVYTDGVGHYVFDNLAPGDYQIQFTPPAGYTFTKQQVPTGTDFNDSNPDATGLTPVFELRPSVTGDMLNNVDPTIIGDFINPTIDAGVVPVVAVGNYVWFDENGDGKQTVGEPGIVGATVELLNPDGTPALDANGDPVLPVLTDENGYYLFDNIPGGTYVIKFTPPNGFGFTKQFAGRDKAVDSNANPLTGLTPPFTVAPDAVGTEEDTDPGTTAVFVNPTIDAGLVPLYAVGNYVWFDTNADGKQSAGERGLPGVGVQLLDENGDPAVNAAGELLPIVYTDEHGFYLFDGLAPGTYSVQFLPPAGLVGTSQNAGVDDAVDSDANPGTGTTAQFTLGPSEPNVSANLNPDINAAYYNPTIDAGFTGPVVAVGDYVWQDANRNGIQEKGELPLAGVTVKLLDVDGNVLGTTTTDANGYYVFDNLQPGAYQAQFVLPPGYLFTPQSTPLSASDNDSNPDTTTGITPVFTVAPAVSGDTVTAPEALTASLINPTVDAGVVPRLGVGNFVWVDADQDGIQDAGELPLGGVWVTLTDANGDPVLDDEGHTVAPVQTAPDGSYLFTKLLPGDYKIRFDPGPSYAMTTANQGADRGADSNAAPSGWTSVFTLNPSAPGMVPNTDPTIPAAYINPTIDAGVIPRVAVGDFAWFDSNKNGLQDKREPVAAGVEVELFDANGFPAVDMDGNKVPIAYTDATGHYLFDNLRPGSYQIKFTSPWGASFTSQRGVSAKDSNASPVTGWTGVFTVEPTAVGDTTVDTNPATVAAFINKTIDVGFVDPDLPVTGTDAGSVGRTAWIISMLGLLLVLAGVRRRRTRTA